MCSIFYAYTFAFYNIALLMFTLNFDRRIKHNAVLLLYVLLEQEPNELLLQEVK